MHRKIVLCYIYCKWYKFYIFKHLLHQYFWQQMSLLRKNDLYRRSSQKISVCYMLLKLLLSILLCYKITVYEAASLSNLSIKNGCLKKSGKNQFRCFSASSLGVTCSTKTRKRYWPILRHAFEVSRMKSQKILFTNVWGEAPVSPVTVEFWCCLTESKQAI